MKYFFVNLACHFIVFIGLVVMMCFTLRRNNKRQTKHGFVYLVPLVLSILAILDMIFFTAPRLLDIKNITSDSYQFVTGKLEKVGSFKNTITVDGQSFYINPLAEKPDIGTTIRIKHTDNAKYVLEMSEASQTANESDSSLEE